METLQPASKKQKLLHRSAEAITSMKETMQNEESSSSSSSQGSEEKYPVGSIVTDPDTSAYLENHSRMSFTDADLAMGKKRGKGRKQKKSMTEEEKREERRAANRLSAFMSRQRRKNTIAELQRAVAQLSKDNADEKKQNLELKQQLALISSENETLRRRLEALRSGGGGAAGVVQAAPAPTTTSALNQFDLSSLLALRQDPLALLRSLAAAPSQTTTARAPQPSWDPNEVTAQLLKNFSAVAGQPMTPQATGTAPTPSATDLMQLQQQLMLLRSLQARSN